MGEFLRELSIALFLFLNLKIGYGVDQIKVAGTGSMAPTFPKGESSSVYMISYPNKYYKVDHKDIVTVENEKILAMSQAVSGQAVGWIKRVIGLPGDTIELRSGSVYLNGQVLDEPYTLRAQSTFGETYLRECKKITVPENMIFVMGDNRKGSGDSREVGFVEMTSIDHVLPFKKQVGLYDKLYRDTKNDLDPQSQIVLDKEKYLELLNAKRREANVKPLKYETKLEKSATLRGEKILAYDDMSFEATRSGYTMKTAMAESHYSNIVYGEAPTLGYFEADELIDNQFQFPDSSKFLLNKEFQDIGIGVVQGSLNGCPTEIVVQHFAGYVPPNYKKSDIEQMKQSLANIENVRGGWERLTSYSEFYQKNKTDVDRINEIIKIRVNNLTQILKKMQGNQWLSDAEEKMMKDDLDLAKEQNEIADRLNAR